MKTTQAFPVTLTRSLLAAGVGCALTVCTVSAQESARATPPQSAGSVDTTDKGTSDKLHTDSAVPRKKSDVKVDTELTNKEKQFINKALEGNTVEVMMAELALKKAEREDVKKFAETMITDHKKANSELSEIDDAHGSSVPSPSLTSEDKALYAQMSSYTGAAFDTAYIKHAVTDHETDVKEYKEAKGEVQDKMLMEYVDKTLPIIEGHLKHAESLQK